jgi:hypothetical protein
MGIAGSYLPAVSMFLASTILVVPALLSLFLIDRGRVEETAGNQPPVDGDGRDDARTTWQGGKSLFFDRRLAIFSACVVLFFAASAAIGPGVAAQVTRRQQNIAALVVAAHPFAASNRGCNIAVDRAEGRNLRPEAAAGDRLGATSAPRFPVRSAAWFLCVGVVQSIECR